MTGADGFIGSAVFNYCASRIEGTYGTVYDRTPKKNQFYLDITSSDSFREASSFVPDEGFDVCIHAAGRVDQNIPTHTMFEVNYGGTKRLLRWLKGVGCRHFIQMSSITVYGKKVVGENRTEQTRRREWGIAAIPYGLAKAKAERAIENSGIHYTLLRLPPVLGKRDSFVTPAVMERIEKKDIFTCSKKPRLVSILIVECLPFYIEQFIALGPQNGAFHIASHHVPWNDFICAYTDCSRESGCTDIPPVVKRGKLSFLFHLRDKKKLLNSMFSAFGSHFSTEKAARLIDLTPAEDWRQGVRQAVDAYRKHC